MWEGGCAGRRLAGADCLLERVGVCQEPVLCIVEPEQFGAYRDAKRRGGARRGEPGLEGDGREARTVGERAIPLRLIVSRDWHCKNLLQRVNDRANRSNRYATSGPPSSTRSPESRSASLIPF